MTWHWLKKSAKRRGLAFTITFQEWFDFVSKGDYIFERGRGKFQLSIDRINGGEGYHIWNIQEMKKGENSAKYHAGDGAAIHHPDFGDESDIPF